jgi:hypothetical protein
MVVSFGLFFWDELGTASDQQTQLAANGSSVGVTRDAHGRVTTVTPTAPRTRLDQINDTLTSPGEGVAKHITPTPSPWALRGLALVFGLLVFGVGLRLLAGFIENTKFRPDEVQAPQTSAEFATSTRPGPTA